jgi:hypothetical protein
MVEFITSLEEMTQKRTSARLKGLASAAAFLVGEHIWWMVAVRLGFARPGVDSTSHSARNVPILQAPVSSAITNDEWDGGARRPGRRARERAQTCLFRSLGGSQRAKRYQAKEGEALARVPAGVINRVRRCPGDRRRTGWLADRNGTWPELSQLRTATTQLFGRALAIGRARRRE